MIKKKYIRFLGTGTSLGVPIIGSNDRVSLSKDFKDKRLRSSVQYISNETVIQIDCGPDFRQQIMNGGRLDIAGALFTHEHQDHTSGLDDLRPIIYQQKRAFPLYAEERVLDSIRHRFHYAFGEKKYPGAPTFEMHNISENKNFKVDNLEVSALRILHGRLPILGFKIEDFVYLTDVKQIPETTIERIINCEVLVISCLRMKKEHHSHLLLKDALAYIKEINPKKAYLTHMSHLIGLHEEVEKQLPKNIYLAYDGLEVVL